MVQQLFLEQGQGKRPISRLKGGILNKVYIRLIKGREANFEIRYKKFNTSPESHGEKYEGLSERINS